MRSIAHHYQEGGLDRALYEKPRPGAVPLLSDSKKQHIVAMVYSEPPDGHARWTVRLIAEVEVKRKLVPAGRPRDEQNPPPKPRPQAVAGKTVVRGGPDRPVSGKHGGSAGGL